MGQAKLRKTAGLMRPAPQGHLRLNLPKDMIARAVREPLLHDPRLSRWETSGSCVQQAEIGRRILVDRYGLDAVMHVGDFMRPMGGGMHHTYTREDGRICVETGACHAWLFCSTTDEYVDLAAWETPRRMQAQGAIWLGPRPDYVWDRPAVLKSQGFIVQVALDATMTVRGYLREGRDAEFLALYQSAALALLDGLQTNARRSSAGA